MRDIIAVRPVRVHYHSPHGGGDFDLDQSDRTNAPSCTGQCLCDDVGCILTPVLEFIQYAGAPQTASVVHDPHTRTQGSMRVDCYIIFTPGVSMAFSSRSSSSVVSNAGYFALHDD